MSDLKAGYSGEDDAVRINKFLSEAGLCSRRQADRLIEEGLIKINGIIAQPGSRVFSGQTVEYNGRIIKKNNKIILIAYNKPKGIECTSDKDNPDNIIDAIDFPERIFYIGRLDKTSTGLILLTNNGDLADAIARSVNGHEKEYIVTVDKAITKDFTDTLSKGVFLDELGVKTKPCRIKKINEKKFDIILTQGLNRQIRRMCDSCGYDVLSLHRIRIMNIHLGELKEGRYRHINGAELKKLMETAGICV